MATPPTLVAEYESTMSSGTTKTVTISANVGDVLVCVAGATATAPWSTLPSGGSGLTWTRQQFYAASTSEGACVWTAKATVALSSVGITVTGDSGGAWACNILRFSGAEGIGATTKMQTTAIQPSVPITTTGDNSSLVYYEADWNETNGARTWRSVNGVAGTEVTYYYTSGAGTVYGAYWQDAGAAGAKTVGRTAPSSFPDSSIVVVEVLAAIASGPAATASMSAAPSFSASGTVSEGKSSGASTNLTASMTAVGVVPKTATRWLRSGGAWVKVPEAVPEVDSVTNAQLANMPASTLKGNDAGSSADPADLTVAQVKTLLALQQSDVSGLVSALAGKLGLSGGTMAGALVLASDPTAALHAATKQYVDSQIKYFGGDTVRQTISTPWSSTSTTYSDIGTALSYTKQKSTSRLRIEAGGTWFSGDGNGILLAVRVDGTDVEIFKANFAVPSGQRIPFNGVVEVSGVAAGALTFQLRGRAEVASHQVNMNADDWFYIDVQEVA